MWNNFEECENAARNDGLYRFLVMKNVEKLFQGHGFGGYKFSKVKTDKTPAWHFCS